MSKLEEVQALTYKDLTEKLDKYGRCALLRCTGFGKTKLCSDLLQNYKRVLFLYPAEIVKNAVERYTNNKVTNVTFMSYMALTQLKDEDIEEIMGTDLIIADEVHKVGADKTSIYLTKLLNSLGDSCHFVGATATPERTDMYDVIGEFFGGNTVFKYTLDDAVDDNLIQVPDYIYATYSANNNISTALSDINKIEDKTTKEEMVTYLKACEAKIHNLIDVPRVLHTNITKSLGELDYMKFIVFFPTKDALDKKYKTVSSWFKTAFPDMKQSHLIITSDYEHKTNISQLKNLIVRPKRIALIFCVDMLNLGYHIDNLSGIVMYRSTESGIIFNQQYGRCLSVGSKNKCIVIDLVGNLKQQALYKQHKSKNKSEEVSERWYNSLNTLSARNLTIIDETAEVCEVLNKLSYLPTKVKAERAYKEWLSNGGEEHCSLEPYANWQDITVEDIQKFIKEEKEKLSKD